MTERRNHEQEEDHAYRVRHFGGHCGQPPPARGRTLADEWPGCVCAMQTGVLTDTDFSREMLAAGFVYDRRMWRLVIGNGGRRLN